MLFLANCSRVVAAKTTGKAFRLAVQTAHPDWSAANVAEAGFGLEQSRKGAQCDRLAPRAHTPTHPHASVVRSHMHRPLYPACVCMPRV